MDTVYYFEFAIKLGVWTRMIAFSASLGSTLVKNSSRTWVSIKDTLISFHYCKLEYAPPPSTFLLLC